MKFSITIFSLFIINGLVTFGQNDLQYQMDTTIVVAGRVPSSFEEIGRSVSTISSNEIDLLPVNNIQDLLEYETGLDIKQRGPEGIQADISVRGGSFEQTLIMIDGIKLSDPQTGHHNMNLPISFSQIERIEILKGQGSRIYGANAFSGVINIIPKRTLLNSLNIDMSGGENNYHSLGINGSVNFGNISNTISLNRSKSDGYRVNTEFENYTLSMNNYFNLNSAVIKTIFGYTDKDFGANSYYTTRFPDQAEKTKTYFASISSEIETAEFIVSPKLYWRNNEDEFVLNKFDHGFYKNNHETNVFGGEIQASTNVLGGSTSFGLEYIQDNIKSNNLGEHNRQTKGFFIEQRVELSNDIHFSMGGFAYYYSQIEWKFWPGIDVAYNAFENFKIFANYGRAFRVPTYTELFYSDPITLGNSELQPEQTNNYEVGINYHIGIIKLNSSYFRKEGKNLIDYVLDTEDDLWKARNFTEINTDGLEFGVSVSLSRVSNDIVNKIALSYTYLDLDKADLGVNSRYVLDQLKHDFSAKLYHRLPLGIMQSWAINYEDRLTLGDHFTIDAKMSKNFSHFNIYVKASNLLNKSYEEIPGVPLPGRWIIGGVKLKIL